MKKKTKANIWLTIIYVICALALWVSICGLFQMALDDPTRRIGTYQAPWERVSAVWNDYWNEKDRRSETIRKRKEDEQKK